MKVYVLLAIALVWAGGRSASADYVLRFQAAVPVVSGVAQFNLNSDNVVSLYLDATGTSATDLGTNGLITANLGDPSFASLGVLTLPSVTLTGIGTIVSAAPEAAFTDSPIVGISGTKKEAAWTASVGFDPSIKGTLNGATRSVLLGKFTVKSGSVFGNNGLLTITTPNFVDSTTGDFALDLPAGAIAVSSGSGFAFTAVPEPTSMALVGVVGVGGLVARYRRRGLASLTV